MTTIQKKLGIGARLKEFGLKNFKNIKEFAAALEMKPPSLYSYLDNKIAPGAPVLYKLKKLGCDINWLLSDEGNEAESIEIPPHIIKEVELLRKENEELKQTLSKLRALLGKDAF